LDLETEIAVKQVDQPRQLVHVELGKTTLFTRHRDWRTTEYTIKNSGDAPKQILVERQIDPRWTLVEPKEPAEKTRELYRFAIEAPPGEPALLRVAEEQTIEQQQTLLTLNEGQITALLSESSVSPDVKTALGKFVERKQALTAIQAALKETEVQIEAINEEQERIRQNMAGIDRTSDLYERYIDKMEKQETQMEELRQRAAELRQDEQRAQETLQVEMPAG
jgi:hypothetical protein